MIDEKLKKDIDNIVWWIPFKKLRNSVRNYMLSINNLEQKILNSEKNVNDTQKAIDNRIDTIHKRFLEVKEKLKNNRFNMEWEYNWLCLDDNTETTEVSLYKLLFVSWISRILNETKPKKHIDIASDFANLILPISGFIDIDFYDIRPVIPPFEIKGLNCIDGSITNLNIESNSVESISSFSVIEHIGLERYGDSFDPEGDIKAIKELIRVTKKGGNIFISLPISSKAIIQYNAHRVYTPHMIIEYFTGCILKEFKWINTKNEIISDIDKVDLDPLSNLRYLSEGLFWFIKN